MTRPSPDQVRSGQRLGAFVAVLGAHLAVFLIALIAGSGDAEDSWIWFVMVWYFGYLAVVLGAMVAAVVYRRRGRRDVSIGLAVGAMVSVAVAAVFLVIL
jgi:hypothetical protein